MFNWLKNISEINVYKNDKENKENKKYVFESKFMFLMFIGSCHS